MAGDWIKMRSNLWDDPRVARLCDLTDQGEATIIGALYWLWSAADQHTEDGSMPGLSIKSIDRKSGVSGFGKALHDVGWIEEDGDGITIVRFDEHNGASAKRRATDAKRKASVRKPSADSPQSVRSVSASDAEGLRSGCGGSAELEKEKEKEKEEEKEGKSNTDARNGALSKPDYLDAQVWNDYRSFRTSKKAKLTRTAWSRIEKEIQAGIDRGYDPNDMLGEAMEAGWTGFKLDWYEKRIASNAESGKPETRSGPNIPPEFRGTDWARQREAEWRREHGGEA